MIINKRSGQFDKRRTILHDAFRLGTGPAVVSTLEVTLAKKSARAKAKNAVAPLDQVAENIGESLGNFLNRVENQWKSVRGQRDSLVKHLQAIRDKANALLEEAGEIELRTPVILKGRRKPKSSKAKAGRPKKAGKG